jgi:hypothetical protein
VGGRNRQGARILQVELLADALQDFDATQEERKHW